jgi:hypothetical protein
MDDEQIRAAHIRNARAIEAMAPEELERRRGQYAIVAKGEIISFHATNREALTIAAADYKYGQCSVQRVEPFPAEIGFADFAIAARQAP